MFDPVQTPPEPHYPAKLNTKFEFQNLIFKIQFSKFNFQNSNLKKNKNSIFKNSNFYNSNFQNVDKI